MEHKGRGQPLTAAHIEAYWLTGLLAYNVHNINAQTNPQNIRHQNMFSLVTR